MAGIAYTKLIEALRGIGVDVSQQSGSNVKTLATKNKSSATKPGLLAGERDTGGNFATVLDIFKKEARYIDGMNDVEQMNFLNNIMDYNEFGGPKILSTSELNQQARDLGLEFKGLRSDKEDITSGIENILKTSKTMKDDAEAGLASAEKDLKDFLDTGGQPLKAKSDKYLGGSMHEEGQLRTAIRTFLKNEFKNGKIKLDKDDQFRIMEYSPMMEDDPIKVFKKIYGNEAYNKAGTFPGAFEKGENFTHYESIFKENMGEDLLKVKDKKYVGDGTLTLTKQEEVVTPTPDEDMPFAKGGRASFAGGKLVDEFILMITKKEPVEAMKEVNKVLGKKGKYKNLTQKDIDRIVDQTEDHIFQRDPDNLYVEDVDISQGMIDLDEMNFTKNAQAALKKIKEKPVDDMSVEDSLTTMEGLGATQTAERFRLKQKYPGISDDLLTNIIEDTDPVHKASVLAKIDQAMELTKRGKNVNETIQILESEPKTKMATGGRAGFAGGGTYQMDLPFGEPLFTMVMNKKLYGIYQNKDGSRLSVPLGSDGKPNYAKGGRAGYYGGGQAMIEPDLSDVGHGSDALMARTRLTAPGSQATTSTGLNYLLGEDNDNTRIPFRFGGKGPGKVLQDKKKLNQMMENFLIKEAPYGILTPRPKDLELRNLKTADRPPEPEIKIGPYDPQSGINPYSKDNVVEFDDGTFMYKDNGKYFKVDEEDEPYEVPGPSKGAKIKPIEMEAAEGGRAGFNQGLLVPPKKPVPPANPFNELMRIYKTYEEAMPGVSKDTQQYLQNDFKEKLQNANISVEEFMTYRMQNNFAEGGRIGFQSGLNFDKKIEKMLEQEIEEDKNIFDEGEKILTKKLDSFIPNETEKEKKEREMFKMVEEFQTLKKNGILRPDEPFERFKKMKTLKNIKNKILELNVKYPEKKIINDEGMVNKENLKEAIDKAEADLEISPIDGLKLKRSINTEGEQSVTSGSFDIGNLNFSSDNIEEGELTSKGNYSFGDLDLSGMVNSNDGQILETGLGFNYDNALKGKMQNSDGYRSTELDLNKTFPINDKFNLNLTGSANTQTFDGKTYKSSDLTPKLSYNDGILSADISKEIMDGGDFNLNAGASFPINQKTFTGDLILDANGEPTYNSDGSLKRKRSYNTDMGVVTLKGNNLFTDNMGGTIGYQKEFGNKEGDLFFTGGAEKNIFDDGYTVGAGLKYKFADGGIAGLRQGYAGGKGVDIARRGFLKLLGGTAAGVVALKTGLVKMFGKESGAISKKAIDEVIIEGGSGAPAWLQPLVNKALREGTDISKQAVKDGQVVKSLDTPTGKVDVYYDTRTGEIDIDYIGGNTALGESVNMKYVPGVADEGTKGVKPADEFEANEAIPQLDSSSGNFSGSHQIAEMGENVTTDVKGLYSDTSELAELGGQKPLIKDISETIKKKKVLKKMNENPDEFAMENAPEYYD